MTDSHSYPETSDPYGEAALILSAAKQMFEEHSLSVTGNKWHFSEAGQQVRAIWIIKATRAVAQEAQRPLAWRYELAGARFWNNDDTPGEYTNWVWRVSDSEPNAGDAMRNVTPLYALPSTLLSTPWDAHHNRSYEPVETAAKEIYDFFEYKGTETKPAWVPGGNSLMQDEARVCARRQLREAGHTPQLSSPGGK